MTDRKPGDDTARILYKSEIFKDGPGSRRQLRQQHRRRAGPGDLRRRHRVPPAAAARQDAPRAGARDPRLRRDRRARRRRRTGGNGCGRSPPRGSAPTCLLVERYNHLGGLSTGGLVIWIDRMSDWSGRHIIRGFAEEIMDRLPKERGRRARSEHDWGSKDAATAAYWAQRTSAFHGIVTWSPTVDPEALKTVSMQMVGEAKVRLLLHAWAAAPDPGRQRRQGRHLREQGGPPRHPGQGGGRHHRRCRPLRAHRMRPSNPTSTRATSTTASTRPSWSAAWTWSAWLAFRRDDPKGFSEFMALGRVQAQVLREAVRRPGATTSRSSWGRACPATAPSTSRT